MLIRSLHPYINRNNIIVDHSYNANSMWLEGRIVAIKSKLMILIGNFFNWVNSGADWALSTW